MQMHACTGENVNVNVNENVNEYVNENVNEYVYVNVNVRMLRRHTTHTKASTFHFST